MDESYRKTGKMDTTDFSTNLDVYGSGLVESIRSQLLGWEASPRRVKAELYKLNAYGELIYPLSYLVYKCPSPLSNSFCYRNWLFLQVS